MLKVQIEFAFRRSFDPLKWGSNGTEMDLHAVYLDAAAGIRNEKTLSEHAPILEELAKRSDHKLYLAIAHRAFGIAHRLAGEYEQAESRLNRARELFQSLETRWQMGRTLAELGELELARQNERAAHDHFSCALAEFDALGAAPDAARIRARLQSLLQ